MEERSLPDLAQVNNNTQIQTCNLNGWGKGVERQPQVKDKRVIKREIGKEPDTEQMEEEKQDTEADTEQVENLGHQRGKCSHNGLQTAAPYTDFPLPPLKPQKVWIVYSADHLLYVDVVLKFAEFLMIVCGTAVALDLLEDHQISELGPLPWLTQQKKEMEDLSSKIIILCSRGTQAKWQAMLGSEPVCLKQDQQKPMGDLFTPALNLILPDFKKPACFGMYVVCYFEGISSEKDDTPDLFNITSRYQLMDKFEDIYFRIQDLEKFEPGRIHIQEITAENYIKTPSGRKLKEAVQKFRNWQTEHTDWFECETICLDNDEELQALNRESQVDLVLSELGGIVKHQLHLREPDPHCCYVVNLHMLEGESGGCKLQPQLNLGGNPTSQTMVLPMDEALLVQVVEPVSSMEDRNILGHNVLSNEDCMEGVPLLETSFPMRNNVILHDDFEVSVIDDQSSANLSVSFLQSDLSAKRGQLVFDQCKDQRQSVQLDQGYISTCSPLPPDDLLEEEEEEEEEEEDDQEKQMVFQELSPEVPSMGVHFLWKHKHTLDPTLVNDTALPKSRNQCHEPRLRVVHAPQKATDV
ncbi:LOW QUALITY PROTEIN: interleukin-17 receptor A-like [Podargus strigoides]